MTARSGDAGFVLVGAMIAMLVLAALLAATLKTSDHAGLSSVRDRNFDLALDAAEAGVDQAIARIEASGGGASSAFTGSTGTGAHTVSVEWQPGLGYTVDSTGSVGTARRPWFRSRRVRRVTLRAPVSFKYAVFSDTDLVVKNNSTITGDVWANRSVTVEQNSVLDGSLTSAQSWIDIGSGASVTGRVQTGSFFQDPSDGDTFALRIGLNAVVGGDATVSTASGCPSIHRERRSSSSRPRTCPLRPASARTMTSPSAPCTSTTTSTRPVRPPSCCMRTRAQRPSRTAPRTAERSTRRTSP